MYMAFTYMRFRRRIIVLLAIALCGVAIGAWLGRSRNRTADDYERVCVGRERQMTLNDVILLLGPANGGATLNCGPAIYQCTDAVSPAKYLYTFADGPLRLHTWVGNEFVIQVVPDGTEGDLVVSKRLLRRVQPESATWSDWAAWCRHPFTIIDGGYESAYNRKGL